jgi:hypothetical protein
MSKISSLQLSHFHLGVCHRKKKGKEGPAFNCHTHLEACRRKNAQRCSLQVSHSHLGPAKQLKISARFLDETTTFAIWTADILAVARPQMKLTKDQTSKLTFLRWQAPRWHCDTCKPDGRDFLRWQVPRWNCDTPNVNRWDFCSGKFPGETVTFHLCSGVIQVLLTNLNLIRGSAQPFSSIEALLSLKSCHLFWSSERDVLGNIVFFPLVYPEIRLARDRVKLQEAPCLPRCLVCSQLRWKGRRTDLFTPVAMQLLVWAWANSSGADLGGSGKYPHEEFGKQIQVNSNGQWTWVSRSSEKGMF